MIQNCDLEKILPNIIENEDKKKKFSQFIKICYNESIRNTSANSKNFKKLTKNLLLSLFQKAKEGNKEIGEYINQFFINDIIADGIKAI